MENLIWANLQHRPTRSFVTMLGIALGTVLIMITVGLARGFVVERGQRESNIGAEIIVRAAGTFSTSISSNQPSLPMSRADEFLKISGVKSATPVIQYIQASDTGFGFRSVEGIEFEQYTEISGIKIISGHVAQTNFEANIDEELAKSRKIGPGSDIEVMGQMMKVAGVYSPPSGARIKLKLSAMQALLATPGLCSMILVKCINPGDQERIAKQIQDMSLRRIENISTENGDQVILTRDLPMLYAKGLPKAFTVFLNVIVGLSIGISTLVVFLAMYTTISERKREIGILKSLGASKAFILYTIEKEALVLSFSGAILGFLISLCVRYLITHLTSLRYIEFETQWIFISFIAALLGGSLGSFYPAIRATRLDPVKVLNYE